MSVPGHECHAYCRPDEGLHCDTDSLWARLPHEPGILEDECARAVGHLFIPTAGHEYRIVAANPASELPPETREAFLTECTVPVTADFDQFAFVGHMLVWFRVPAEVPA